MEQLFSSLQDLALFVEVVRAGSYRRAAARLSVPVSTLSRRISAMEKRLGAPLLVRTTRSVTLVNAAKPFFERCLDVMDAAQRAEEALEGGPGRPALLRVAMPVDLGVEMLGPVIARFADARPDLRVEFDLSSRAVDLMREPVDLAFRIGRPMDDRVVARKVADISSGVYASPALLRRLPLITTADQLATLPCLDLRTAQGSMPWKVGSLRWDGAPGECRLAANSVALIRRFAQEGRGLALLPDHLVAQRDPTERLVRILCDLPTTTWPVYAVTAVRAIPRQVRQLIAHVKSELAGTSVALRSK